MPMMYGRFLDVKATIDLLIKHSKIRLNLLHNHYKESENRQCSTCDVYGML